MPSELRTLREENNIVGSFFKNVFTFVSLFGEQAGGEGEARRMQLLAISLEDLIPSLVQQ